MMTTPRLCAILCLGLAVSTPVPANAQLPDSAECSAAASALSSGLNRTGRGWGRIARCGSLGETAVADAIAAAGSETDTLYLALLMGAGLHLRSVLIFDASRVLANDTAASVAARVMAMGVMLAQIAPGLTFSLHRPFHEMVTVPSGSWCWPRTDTNARYSSEVSAPSTARIRDAADVLTNVSKMSGALPVLRDYARCGRISLEPQVPQLIDPKALLLTYVCGNLYRVDNSSGSWVLVFYRVVETTETRPLNVGPEAVAFETNATGTVELLYNGQVVGQAVNSRTRCS